MLIIFWTGISVRVWSFYHLRHWAGLYGSKQAQGRLSRDVEKLPYSFAANRFLAPVFRRNFHCHSEASSLSSLQLPWGNQWSFQTTVASSRWMLISVYNIEQYQCIFQLRPRTAAITVECGNWRSLQYYLQRWYALISGRWISKIEAANWSIALIGKVISRVEHLAGIWLLFEKVSVDLELYWYESWLWTGTSLTNTESLFDAKRLAIHFYNSPGISHCIIRELALYAWRHSRYSGSCFMHYVLKGWMFTKVGAEIHAKSNMHQLYCHLKNSSARLMYILALPYYSKFDFALQHACRPGYLGNEYGAEKLAGGFLTRRADLTVTST